jgi:hypothetical protein
MSLPESRSRRQSSSPAPLRKTLQCHSGHRAPPRRRAGFSAEYPVHEEHFGARNPAGILARASRISLLSFDNPDLFLRHTVQLVNQLVNFTVKSLDFPLQPFLID